jgi:L-lactate dehydrogenase complex protein LldG
MSDARSEILARIAAIPRSPAPAPVRAYRESGVRTPEAVVDLFCERVADYQAEVLRISPESVASRIGEVAAAHGGSRFGIPTGLRTEWRPPGYELVTDTSLDTAGFDSLGGAITGCTAAIAETGTIILAAGPETGRRALTLIPDLHICVVDRSQIVELVPEGLRRTGVIVRAESRPITLVSGPSATSDIELSRVEGVHGPRHLVVLVVDG